MSLSMRCGIPWTSDVISESKRQNPYLLSCDKSGVSREMELFKRLFQIRNFAVLLFPIIFIASFPAHSLSASPSFSIAPPPAWILPPPAPDINKAQQDEEGAGVKHLFSDHQIRASSGSVDRYIFRSTKVLSSARLEDVSKLELEFEPSYQKLVIHYIRIRRGSQIINALMPKETKIWRQFLRGLIH
jgi:hypothetical protein